MHEIIEKLKNYGCDTDGALKRVLDDEDFLILCINSALDGDEFVKLGDALKNKDIKNAFEYAHALKGVLSNVGLTPLYNIIVQIVEILRAENLDGTDIKYITLMNVRQELCEMLADN